MLIIRAMSNNEEAPLSAPSDRNLGPADKFQRVTALLLSLVPADGSSIGNTTLRQEIEARLATENLALSEDEYWQARNALIAQGVLVKGQGRGGSVRRATQRPENVHGDETLNEGDLAAGPSDFNLSPVAAPSSDAATARSREANTASGGGVRMNAPDPADTVPDYQSLMLPVLRAVAAGEQHIGAVVKRLGEELGLSEAARAALLPSGRQTIFANRVHWAKTYLAKAGLVETTKRGHFRLTQRGADVLAANPERIDNRFLSRFEEFRQFSARSAQPTHDKVVPEPADAAEQTPDEIMRAAHRRIEAALAEELLDRVRAAPPDFFERLIINLLLAMGYGGSAAEAGRALGRSGDDGVDGVIDQDALGLDRVYIQAKRYAAGNSVGPGAIREFFGSLDRHKAAKGLFVTTSTFTESAIQTAESLSKRIVLIDGEQLADLMIRYKVGCRVEEELHVMKVDEDFFE